MEFEKLEWESETVDKEDNFLIELVVFASAFVVIVFVLNGLLNFFIGLMIVIVAVSYIIWINYKQKQIKKLKENKDENLKKQGYIIETKAFRRGNHNSGLELFVDFGKIYCLKIKFDNKTIYVKNLKNDNAYKIIKLLLEPYPIKEEVLIPIDVYFLNNKIFYVDIDSVKLNEIEGYEEVKSLLNKESKI